MANKYPKEIYRAYNDVEGTNLTALEIDNLPAQEVKDTVVQGLGGGLKEFNNIVNGLVDDILSRKSISVIDRLANRVSKKECEEWKCGCGKHNPNEFNNCEKCGAIKSHDNATKEIRGESTELTDTGVPLDQVLNSILDRFPDDFKLKIDNLDELIDEIRKVISRPSGGDYVESGQEYTEEPPELKE